MSMEINNNYGSGYINPYTIPKNNSGSTENTEVEKFEKKDASKKTAGYYSELQKKYDCIKGGNVSISGKYLQQCAGDAKKAKELEDFLQKIPELEKQGYEQLSAQNAALGGKVTFYQQTWMINDDGSVQSSVYSVTETEMTNAERMKKNMDERLEKQKEKKEEEEKIRKQKEDKAEQMEKTKRTQDTEDLKVSVEYIKAESEEEAILLMRQEKKEGAYLPKVDLSI